MFILLLISTVLIASVLLFNTSNKNIYINNKQLQARQICIAGLNVFMEHLNKEPKVYSSLLIPDTNFSLTVDIPYKYAKSDTKNFNDEFKIAKVNIDVTKDTSEKNKLVATATTEYDNLETSISLEIFYEIINNDLDLDLDLNSDLEYKFTKGNFLYL